MVTANGRGPQVTDSYLYDPRRLLISEALTVGNQFTWAVGYAYDANGHPSVRFTPSGQSYYTSPDALGQPDLRSFFVATQAVSLGSMVVVSSQRWRTCAGGW